MESSREVTSPVKTVAIIGMACHYPGCDTIGEYWDLLMNREVKIQHFRLPDTSTNIHGAFTTAIETFDSEFFKIPLWELRNIDPQQTLSITTAYEALSNAGLNMDRLSGRNIGVFVGVCNNDARLVTQDCSNNPYATAFTPSLIPNRVSHMFGFQGPSMTIDTSCASSLSAVQVACSSMLNGDCDTALVGGVNALLHESMFNVYLRMGMLSPTGDSKVFDDSANGFVRGEGCGFIVLQLIQQEYYNNNRVLAIIRSIASNHNGHLTHHILSPSVESQRTLLQTVLNRAKISRNEIDYIEAHGTGTRVGDRNEIESIKSVFGDRLPPVNVGSVKANIGHLEGGAGIAGLIKAVMVINKGVSPGNAGLGKLFNEVGNSLVISNHNLPLFRESLHSSNQYYTAVVNSFGYGGVNVSAIIQLPISNTCCDSMPKELSSHLNPTMLPGFYERFEFRKCISQSARSSIIETTLGDNFETTESDKIDYEGRELCTVSNYPFAVDSGYSSVINSPEKRCPEHYKIVSGNELSERIEDAIRKSRIRDCIYENIQSDIEEDEQLYTVDQIACINLFSLGLDSFSVIQMSTFIKKTFQVTLTYSDLIKLKNIDNITAHVLSQSQQS